MPVLIPSGFRPGPARTTVRIPVGEQGGMASWRASEGARSAVFMTREDERNLTEERESGEVHARLDDLDSLRQSLLGAEERQQERRKEEEDWEEVEAESRWSKDGTGGGR